MSGGLRVLLLIVGAAAAIVLFAVFRGGADVDHGDPPSTTQPPVTAVTTNREPPPKPEVILVPTNTDAQTRRTIQRGRQVILVISGAAGEEVHLHGYDIKRRIGPDGTVRLPFRATIPGRFEIELEESHRQIADLTVR